jgi:Family of unknown function (DUF6188)
MDSFDFSCMVGRVITGVQHIEPSQWSFAVEPSLSVGVECPWRILDAGRIAISSEDHLQQYGLPAPLDAASIATNLLASRSITRVEVRERTADLLLEFEGDLRLEVVPFSTGYESWNIFGPSGFHVVAQGGGQLCIWSA